MLMISYVYLEEYLNLYEYSTKQILNNLGSITGGMTSTPALGTLIATAETEDVAGAYASTYPIALVLIVLSCNLMIGLI